MEVEKSGYLPYAIVDGWQQLAKDFAYWRVETAALARDPNPEHRAWYARDMKLREALIVRDLGVWSHYVGDGSMPMHVSIYYNGWGDFPNPDGFTRAPIHAVFEGTYVKSYVTIDEVRARLRAYQACAKPIEACTADYLHATWSEVLPTYQLEKKVGYNLASPQATAFIADRIAAGASELRDLIVDAWNASETDERGLRRPRQAGRDAPGRAGGRGRSLGRHLRDRVRGDPKALQFGRKVEGRAYQDRAAVFGVVIRDGKLARFPPKWVRFGDEEARQQGTSSFPVMRTGKNSACVRVHRPGATTTTCRAGRSNPVRRSRRPWCESSPRRRACASARTSRSPGRPSTY